jgi:hypothetical protein
VEVALPEPVPNNSKEDSTGWSYKDKQGELAENRHARYAAPHRCNLQVAYIVERHGPQQRRDVNSKT